MANGRWAPCKKCGRRFRLKRRGAEGRPWKKCSRCRGKKKDHGKVYRRDHTAAIPGLRPPVKPPQHRDEAFKLLAKSDEAARLTREAILKRAAEAEGLEEIARLRAKDAAQSELHGRLRVTRILRNFRLIPARVRGTNGNSQGVGSETDHRVDRTAAPATHRSSPEFPSAATRRHNKAARRRAGVS